jgi:ATP-dependent RNA helicase RhlB
VPAASAATAASIDGEAAPRKRRRRRGGKRIEGADAASAATPMHATGPSQVVATRVTPKPVTTTESPSLLSRLGRGLKSLVKRAPRSQH